MSSNIKVQMLVISYLLTFLAGLFGKTWDPDELEVGVLLGRVTSLISTDRHSFRPVQWNWLAHVLSERV